MNPLEIIAQDLFDKVRSRFENLQMGDEAGSVTLDPKDARFFDFDFVLEGNNLGRVSISINEVGSLKVYYSQGIVEGIDHITAGLWYDFLKEMRQFAKRRLLRFDTRDITKGNLDKNDFQYLAQTGTQETNMQESNYYGSSMSSYRKLEDTKLIIRHSKAVAENVPGARSRHINALFIENAEGERFKYPYIHLAGAKAMQRHVANGGNPFDAAGQTIVGMSEAICQLGKFKRQVGNVEQLTNEARDIIEHVGNKLSNLRSTVEAITKQTHYEEWRESLDKAQSNLTEIDDATLEDYKAKFTISSFKEDLTQYFPLLFKVMQEAGTVDLEDIVHEGSKEQECDDCGKPLSKCECDKETKEGFEAFEAWAEQVVDGNQDALEEAPNKSDVPAYKRKASGDKDWKVTQKDLDAEKEKNISHADTLRKNRGVGEGYYLGPEDLPDWTKDALQRVKNGEVRGWEELSAELTGDMGIDDHKADIIAKRVFGYKKNPAHYQAPTDRVDAPRGDDSEDDDNDFLAKMRARVAGGGTFKQDDFGAEVGEELKPQASAKDIAEVVKSMFDRETGKFPRGETGVVLHVKKEFGDRAGDLAERLVNYLKSKHEDKAQMESILKLAGLPVLTK